jgi:BirA family transcriptional regulator, biotin operon repressor / biotin---[acetyl-CoA-carboxylase] ligase
MLALAAQGADEGLWIRAETQSAGRGRMGRNWVSPKGNLYASTLIRLQETDPAAATLGLVAGIAVHEVIADYTGIDTIRIKWPNDIVANGAKLSGILLERAGDSVVIGIGINLVTHPALADRATTSIAELTGYAPDPAACTEALAESFARAVGTWRRFGLREILQRWQHYAHPVGTAVAIHLPDGEMINGRYEGLGDDGALTLKLATGGVRAIHAGDVFLI